ncbi:MAG: OadG family protein [Clostridia bacterium]|nr:OadG family protein [Clostridia bacterium]
MSKKKIIKAVIICVVFVALIAGLITLMIHPLNFGGNAKDSLEILKATFGERLLTGLQVAVLGIATVFVMLILLIIFVTLMRLIFQGVGKLKEKNANKKAKTTNKQDVAVTETAGEDDEEIVAVIMTAIQAYYETQDVTYKSNLKFRVRSIKEI